MRREGGGEGPGSAGLRVWSFTGCPASYLTQQLKKGEKLCFSPALIPLGQGRPGGGWLWRGAYGVVLGSPGCQPGFCCFELGQITWNFPCLVSSLRMRLLGWNGGSLCCSPLPSQTLPTCGNLWWAEAPGGTVPPPPSRTALSEPGS